MNYLLNEDQRGFQDSLTRFLQARADGTFLHDIADNADTRGHALAALWRDFCALGFAGMLVPVEYDGLGLGLQDAALITETLGAHVTPLPFLSHQLCCLAIARAGNPEQQARWLPLLASGARVGSIALRGQAGQYHPDSWQSLASDQTLSFCPVLGDGEIPHVIVVGLQGGELAVIEVCASAMSLQPGVDLTRFLANISVQGRDLEMLPEGRACAETLYHAGLALLAADSVGGTVSCVERAVDYAKLREQFGVQIGQFQAVKHQIADIALNGEPNRPLCWYAAHAVDSGLANAGKTATLAKAHVCDAYLASARQTVELHGGFGYTWEADIHFYLKRAMFNSAFLGNSRTLRSQIQAS